MEPISASPNTKAVLSALNTSFNSGDRCGDEEIIEYKLLENGDLFCKLFPEGNTMAFWNLSEDKKSMKVRQNASKTWVECVTDPVFVEWERWNENLKTANKEFERKKETKRIKVDTVRTLLAKLVVLPKLINGKVCIINEDGRYTLCKVPSTVMISDGFNPEEYVLLNNSKWKNLIVYSTPEEREHHLVNKVYQEMLRKEKAPVYRVGDKIHIHSRRGIYTLVGIEGDILSISCNKWRYESNPVHKVHKSDFKCLAGGTWNQVFQ